MIHVIWATQIQSTAKWQQKTLWVFYISLLLSTGCSALVTQLSLSWTSDTVLKMYLVPNDAGGKKFCVG